METLIINDKRGIAGKMARAFIGFYFLIFSGYFVFTEGAADRYGLLLFFSVVGFLIALLLFLINTLWLSNKPLLAISEERIDSRVPSSKLKMEWVSVSNVTIKEDDILFFLNGGKKERNLKLLDFRYKDIGSIKTQVIELCKHKNIVYTIEE